MSRKSDPVEQIIDKRRYEILDCEEFTVFKRPRYSSRIGECHKLFGSLWESIGLSRYCELVEKFVR